MTKPVRLKAVMSLKPAEVKKGQQLMPTALFCNLSCGHKLGQEIDMFGRCISGMHAGKGPPSSLWR